MKMKPWFYSKTIWTNILAIVGVLLAQYTGVTLSADETIAILAVVNLVLRVVTKTGLTT